MIKLPIIQTWSYLQCPCLRLEAVAASHGLAFLQLWHCSPHADMPPLPGVNPQLCPGCAFQSLLSPSGVTQPHFLVWVFVRMPGRCWVMGPMCRGTQPAGWGPGPPRHRTWTSHSHDWCPLAAHRRSEDNGITQNWSLLRMCRVRWYSKYLQEKSKRVLHCPQTG